MNQTEKLCLIGKHRNGFTLMELMITVAVVGILAALAIPSYTNHTTKARRTDAQAALAKLASDQERYFSQCGHYAKVVSGARACGDLTDQDTWILGNAAAMSENQYYDLSFSAGAIASASCSAYTCGFIAIATPRAGQTGNGILRLDSTGVRQWDKNNDNDYADAGESSWK